MSDENVKTETGEAVSAKKVGRNEIGRIGQYRYGIDGNESIFMEEFLPELQGIKAIHTYTEMLDNDATIGGIWFAIEMLMRNTSFQIEPGGEADIDKEAADFVESCMYDEAQQRVYALENPTLDQINGIYRETAVAYGFAWEGDVWYDWVDSSYLFEKPFYDMSYAAAYAAALEYLACNRNGHKTTKTSVCGAYGISLLRLNNAIAKIMHVLENGKEEI